MLFFVGVTFHPDWMTKLPKDLINAPLKDIAIPGSHDSASYSLDVRNGFAPLLPKKVRQRDKTFYASSSIS